MAEEIINIELHPHLDFELHKLPELKTISIEAAQQIAEAAKSSAPVDSGSYAASIRAEETVGGARVVSDDYKASWIEFGAPNRNIPAKWVLRSAAEGLGYKFRKKK